MGDFFLDRKKKIGIKEGKFDKQIEAGEFKGGGFEAEANARQAEIKKVGLEKEKAAIKSSKESAAAASPRKAKRRGRRTLVSDKTLLGIRSTLG